VLVVATEEGLVVLVEVCSAASVPASMSAAGAAAKPPDGLAAATVVVELLVVVTVVTLLTVVDTAATRGTAVHRRPLRVVRKAPDGSPLDAISQIQSLFDNLDARSQPLRNEEDGDERYKNTTKIGSVEAKMKATRAE
jgi:hypothetical protein